MDTLYFLFCIVAIFWLALWSIRDPKHRSRLWWPFAMKADADAPAPTPAPPGPPRPGRRAAPPVRHQVARHQLAPAPKPRWRRA